MKLKHLALIVAVAIGASNLTVLVIRVLDQSGRTQAHERIEANTGSARSHD